VLVIGEAAAMEALGGLESGLNRMVSLCGRRCDGVSGRDLGDGERIRRGCGDGTAQEMFGVTALGMITMN
jgi:hypothetical protein